MAESAKKPAKKPVRSAAASSEGFTDQERAAIKERAQEVKAASRRGRRASKADPEGDVLAKIAEMAEPDRAMAERVHAIIKASAPTLAPKLWYGMPAYAKDGKVVWLLPGRTEVRHEVRDARLQRQREPRRRHHVADRLRADRVDRRRTGTDRGAREEVGELTGPAQTAA